MKTDWDKIENETQEIISGYGSKTAEKAFELILGDEWIKDTVNKAIQYDGGSSELAMNCLKLISSEKAADFAYSTYKNDNDSENKAMAVWLIKHLAVKKSYYWIEEFLNDKNVIGWGIGVLDQLLWTEKIDYEDEKEKIDYLFNLALTNSNGELKENVDFIKKYLKDREKVE